MCGGQLRVPCHFDPAVQVQSALRNVPGELAITGLARLLVQDNRHGFKAFSPPLRHRGRRHGLRFHEDDFDGRHLGLAGRHWKLRCGHWRDQERRERHE